MEKPIYDPWEIFQPSKAFLRETVKDLKRQAYATLQKIEEAKNHNPLLRDAFIAHYQNRLFNDYKPEYDKVVFTYWEERYKQEHAAICKRIKDYEFRLRTRGKEAHRQSINASHVDQAKQVSIQTFYTGKLRKAGKDLHGQCPFCGSSRFFLYDNGLRFKCFAGGEEGDAIDFVRKTQNLDFIKSIKYILHL